MKVVLHRLLPAEAVSHAIYEVVPAWVTEHVETFEVYVHPTRAQWREEQLEGARYGLSGVAGQWNCEERKVTVWLGPCWSSALNRYRVSSWPFSAWNTFLSVSYHEFGHVESSCLGIDNHPVLEWMARSGQARWWPAHEKEEAYAHEMSRALHEKADLLGLTIPPEDLGIFSKFIREHRANLLDQFRKGQYRRAASFFDQVRMTAFGLHHAGLYLKSVQELSLSKERPEGVLVVDRAGRRHTYYRHCELVKIFGTAALVHPEHFSLFPPNLTSAKLNEGAHRPEAIGAMTMNPASPR
jgi:hypothetical protein